MIRLRDANRAPASPDALARRRLAEQAVSRWVTVYWGTRRTAEILRGYVATSMVSSQMLSRWVLHRARMQPRYVVAVLKVAPFVERRRVKEGI